jgi:2-polyprenyl-3-methyl-5-hydroxy-6-metoxy-1,4-benzoquinol methylase
VSSNRPFYGQYAWAFDLLIDRPVAKECAVIAGWLVERGVVPGATVLDAGCGTGRYAVELARRGYRVTGVDRSPELVDVAMRSATDRQTIVSFRVGDLLRLPADRFDAILCRGVLNDIIEDDERQMVLAAFAGALRPGGVLVADVREWEATLERKLREPVFRKRVATERGTLTFESITEVDRENLLLRLSETHTLSDDSGVHSSAYQFVMRCWTREELASGLERAGFGRITCFGAFDPLVSPGAADRLVVVASRQSAASRR